MERRNLPFDAGWRKVMMWWFIVTDGLLFAGFPSVGYARILAFHGR
jgi:heme/copper-type cytochrome/quinol oxidase subunit 3